MNNDAAEKANRRKSAHFGDLHRPEVGKKDAAGRRVVSGQQGAGAGAAGSGSGGAGVTGTGPSMMAAKKAKRLSSVVAAAPVVSMEVMSTNFEEWMKLATDNVGRHYRNKTRVMRTDEVENHGEQYLELCFD